MLDKHDYDNLVKEMKEKLNNGFNKEQILEDLQEKKVSIIDAIKVTKDLFTDSLVKAKLTVENHPAWTKIAEEYEKFHNDLFNKMDEDKKD